MATGIRHVDTGEALSKTEMEGDSLHEIHDNVDFNAKGYKNLSLVIEHHTAADTLTKAESGSIHTNLGAGEAIKLTLPQDAVAGTNFKFVVMAAFALQIDPGAAGAIYIGGAKQTDDKYIWADDEAESVELVCDGNGDWIAIATTGTWTVE